MLSAVSKRVTTMPDGPRYEDDFFAWTQHQAMVLRSMAVADNRFDRENVAEEIESAGRCERDAVRSQIRRIIQHLLKLSCSPAQQPRYDWMASIIEARSALGDKISPTLRRDAEIMLAGLYRDGRHLAELALRGYGESQAADTLPQHCPYSLDDIFREDWYPQPPGETP
jgi:hypothetical protein